MSEHHLFTLSSWWNTCHLGALWSFASFYTLILYFILFISFCVLIAINRPNNLVENKSIRLDWWFVENVNGYYLLAQIWHLFNVFLLVTMYYNIGIYKKSYVFQSYNLCEVISAKLRFALEKQIKQIKKWIEKREYHLDLDRTMIKLNSCTKIRIV